MASTRPSRISVLRRMIAAATTGALAFTTLAIAPAAHAEVGFVTDPASYVDTFTGTGSGGAVVGTINNFPGPAAPFGMVQFSPSNGDNGTGYRNGETKLQGFAMNFASQGCTAFGSFPVLPTTIDPTSDKPWDKTSTIITDSEVGEPGYMEMDSRDANNNVVKARLTATTRTGVAEFTFPEGTTPAIVIRSGRLNNKNTIKSALNVNPNNETITGWGIHEGFCGATPDNQYKAYFTAKFEQDFTEYGAWDEGSNTIYNKNTSTDTTDAEVSNAARAGGYVRFAPGTTTVRMKISISYVKTGDLELGQADPDSTHRGGSSLNLATEVPTPDYTDLPAEDTYDSYAQAFDAVRQDTYNSWNELLGKIKVSDTASTRDIGTFYHSLYRSLLHPNIFEDVNGDYAGFDHFKFYAAGSSNTDIPPTIYNIAESNALYGLNQEHVYSNFSDWDTYRSWAPLAALIAPKAASDMAQTYVLNADQWGQFPRWAIANQSTGQMSGDNASALISQVHAFGATDFATDRALYHMYEAALGEDAGKATAEIPLRKVTRPGALDYAERKYAPQTIEHQTDHAVTGASVAQEWSIDDLAVGQFAQRIGEENYPDSVPQNVAELFLNRANYWQNHINPLTRCLSARDYAGRFPTGDDCNTTPGDFGTRGSVTGYGQVGFDEATSEQYLWMAPQNLEQLATVLGGKDIAAERLDSFMEGGYNVGANVPKMWAGNEPNFATPWAYNYLGQPWRTQKVVEDIRTQLFGVGRDGAEPGNDDLGAMSAWYVWAALGLYPATPGTDVLTVNSPNFEKVEFTLGSGKTLTINAPEANTKRYIAGLSVNGEAQTSLAIPDTWLEQDTVLDFTMSAAPTSWGSGPDDAPPSYTYGANEVISYADPVTIEPGDSATMDFAIQKIAATDASYRLDLTGVPAGFSVTTTKSTRFDETGRDIQPLKVTVSSKVEDGDYTFPITVVTGSNDRSTSEVTVRVARAEGFLATTNLQARSDSKADAGHFDGNKSVQSDKLVQAGLVPGETVDLQEVSSSSTLAGLKVRFPVISEGMTDSIVPQGQTVKLSGKPSKISFIGASKSGNRSGTAVVTLDDNTTATANLDLGDWVKPSSTGNLADGTLTPYSSNVKVAWLATRNLDGGTSNDPGSYVYATAPYTAPAGRYIVSVTLTDSGNADRRIFAIAQDELPAVASLPAVQDAPSELAAGGTASVSGSGFTAGESVDAYLGATKVGSGVADSNGNVTVTVTVPRLTAEGSYSLQLRGQSDSSGSSTATQVTITAAQWSPEVSARNSVTAGSQIVFTGTGFGEFEPVTATAGEQSVVLTANSQGRVHGSLPAPANPGSVTLTLAGSLSGASVDKTITVTQVPDGSGVDEPVVLSADPAVLVFGQSTTLRGRVSAGVSGQVEFFDGSKSLGRATISQNVASLKVAGLSAGSHRITAKKVGSSVSSQTVHVLVAKAAVTKVAVKAKKVKRGKAAKVTVKIGALNTGQRVAGTLTVKVGKKTAKTVTVSATQSKVKVKVAKKFTKKKKKLKISANFTPKDSVNILGASSPVKIVKVKAKKK